ncbi:MAG TPA: hypothetical protein VFL54_10885 [Gammaproteobacteria bacterium]|nr:hypothetical protein [Gammaproteobacteria bacterium]
MSGAVELPVPVKDMPHWRVNFRPNSYNPRRVSSLSECRAIVERHQVRMRGWYYPHISHQPKESGAGSDWIGSWCGNGSTHAEYWRFYQSTQFVHLFCVSEAAESAWHQQLLRDTKSHLRHLHDLDLENVPGFMSTVNILYTVSEIVEFMARLAAAAIYEGSVILDVSLVNIKDFVLTTNSNRVWHDYYAAAEDVVHRRTEVDIEELLTSPVAVTQEWTSWIYQCFGWFDAPPLGIRKDIEEYRAGKY